MNRLTFSWAILLALWMTTSCRTPSIPEQNLPSTTTENTMWKTEFNRLLPLLGHRNWILVVDQAYPLQSAPGISTLDTQEPLKTVLDEVLHELGAAKHIKPIVYTDLELKYMDETICPGVTAVRNDLNELLQSYCVQTLLHDDVFGKLDQASKLFNVVVLKTTSQTPYSSVFIELDCGYWTSEGEQALRAAMKADKAQ